jgi:glutathione peroxidase
LKKVIVASARITVILLTIKKKDMTLRQSILKAVYPGLMAVNKLFGKKTTIAENKQMVSPVQSIYDLHLVANSGNGVVMSYFRGKKILLVNTASDCGYTAQLKELQQLQNEYGHKLVVIGFPSNDFRQQESGSDKQIEEFCKVNYGINFLLAKKSVVTKNQDQNEVFKWLTDKTRNGWNDQAPQWNFSKYLVNEQGVLTNYFGSAISPLNEEIRRNL